MVASQDEASLYIYDIIDADYGIGATQVISALNSVKDAKMLHIYINSAGGSVFEGRAMMAAIQRFEGKTMAHIDSLCASAATSIALACDEVEMSDGALFMIHNASGLVYGDKNDMRQTADLLEKIESSIVNDYVTKTGKNEQDIMAFMDAETWFTAAEALDNRFIDRITESPVKVKNAWNLSAFKNAPVLNTEQPVKTPQYSTEDIARAFGVPITVQDAKDESTQPILEGSLMATSNSNKLKLIQSL